MLSSKEDRAFKSREIPVSKGNKVAQMDTEVYN